MNLTNLPQVHPRSALVEVARRDLQQVLLNLRREHKLTEAEYLMLLGEAVGNHTAALVQVERRKRDGQ